MSINKNIKIKKILAVRNDRFGEFLLNIPAFKALKQSFSEAKLTVVVNPCAQELAQGIDSIDEIIVWENKKHKFSEILRFSKQLKSKKFDLCVIFNPSCEFNIIGFLAGIPMRVGYARKWDFLLTHKIEDKKYLGEKHEIEYNLELVNLIGVKSKDTSLSLKVEDNGLFDEFAIGKTIVIHPWTSDPLKQWPIENFVELAKELTRGLNLKVIIVGGKEEFIKSQKYFVNLNNNIINLTGKTTLKELAVLLKKSKLIISGDSGPVHLSSAVGTPVIAIFRNDIPAKSPARWGPWGGKHIIIDKTNLSDITVIEVVNKIKEILDK